MDTTLRAVSMAAGRLGIRAGMRINEARARCAELDIRLWDRTAIDDAVLAGTTTLLTASPQVTPVIGTPGMWWVGATGFAALGGEEMLAQTLLHIARQWHPQARVAIADSCVAARAATWVPLAQITRIPPDRCAHYLATAPLGLLPMPEELREALQALGFRTIGALAALDASDVEERWGADGLTAWRLAHGDDPRRPGLVRTEMARSTTVELPGVAESAEPVLFVVRAQLQRLLNDCVRDGRAAAAVAITLILDAGRYYPLEAIGSEFGDDAGRASSETSHGFDHGFDHGSDHGLAHESRRVCDHGAAISSHLLNVPQRTITREVRPARPLARFDPLFDQCRTLLERWSIPAPIIGVSISIPVTAPLAADQGDLLVPSWRDAAMNAEAVFARLRAALDPEHRGDVVVRPQARDTHRVEETGAWIPVDAMAMAEAALPAAAAPTNASSASSASASTSLPTSSASPVLRLLTTPESVRVVAPHRAPGMIWWRGRRITFTQARGPERLSGDWWRGDRYARDYWRCLSDDDGELLLYLEGVHWYVHGWYD